MILTKVLEAAVSGAANVAWTACTTAAIFSALCTPCALISCLRRVFSCEAMHMPQPLIADTASEASSNAILSRPELAITFMRKPARSCAYSSFSIRWVAR